MPYTVKSGDTLSRIARDAGTTVDDLLMLNPDITNPNLIFPNQTIVLPQDSAEGTVDEAGEQAKTSGPGTASPSPPTPTAERVRIMGGDVKWFRTADGTFYAAYALPGGYQRVVFEASPQQMDAIFGAGTRPSGVRGVGTEADLLKRDGFYFGGGIGEVEGDGDFTVQVNRIIGRAIEDGDLPADFANSQRIKNLLYVMNTEDKSLEWFAAEVLKTPEGKQRFRGINVIMDGGLTAVDAIKAYREYETAAKDVAKRYDQDVSFSPPQIERLLKQGHSVDDIKFTFDIYDRMQKNEVALGTFNSILRAKGMQPLSPADQFRFLAGNAPAELYDIWEASTVRDAAQDFGLNVSAAQAIRAAGESNLDPSQIRAELQETARTVLRYRTQLNTQKYGLKEGDLIDIALGLPPRSGSDMFDIEEKLARAQIEAQGFLRQRKSPYIGFTKSGQPQARSLGELRQSSV